MLVHQAALQQRIWTGSDPDIDAMTAAARAALEHSG
jgi:shikimate 5-dehydrogenase